MNDNAGHMAADPDKRLSEHFVLGDFMIDESFPELAKGLDPDTRCLGNLARLTALLDRIVDAFPPGLEVLSGFRDKRLNDACIKAGLPASVRSLHLSGCAADVKPSSEEVDLENVYHWLMSHKVDIGLHEAVYYPLKGFIHVAVDDPDNPTASRIIMRT